MRRSRRAALLLAAALACLAPSGCVLLASTGEYRLYRKIRLTDSDLTRGQLIRAYERDHAGGALAGDIAKIRRRLDRRLFGRAIDEYGIGIYLRALPDGERRGEAEARLRALERARAEREAVARAEAEQAAAQARQEDQQRRRWFRAAFLGWIQILSRVGGWNTPMPDFLTANAELAAVWREGGVAPVCDENVCAREYPHDYFIRRRGGTRIDRQARFLLRIHQTDGKVTRIDLLLAGQGFFAWSELESQEEIDPEDPAAVAEARQRAKTALTEMLQTNLSGGAAGEVPQDRAATVLGVYVKDPVRIEVVAAPPDAPNVGPGEGLSVTWAPPAPTPPPEPTPPPRRPPARPRAPRPTR